jgi:hypothetical protein
MEHGSGKIGAPFVILLVLVLFYCCCRCCADTTSFVSADAAAELKAEREEEEETAGDGELNQRIMRFRFREEENSAAPAVCSSPTRFASFCCRFDYFSFSFFFRLGPRLF